MKTELLKSLIGDLSSLMKSVFFWGYKKGLKDGMFRFSYMKDGVYYVGTCGTTFKDACAGVDKEEDQLRQIANQEVTGTEFEKFMKEKHGTETKI